MNNYIEYDLDCRYDTRKSFYGKARVVEEKQLNGTKIRLYSYGTLVATIETYKNKTKYEYLGRYSQTTTRHQKEFFKQYGLSENEIKDLFKNDKLIKEF